ncbi:MAG: HAMP domain-containing sensor histidine kinase [Mariprofundaceae bacterium]|nr:HAMP domain-containing sensor histidine kinase [Mariprofundaceae bacterium]
MSRKFSLLSLLRSGSHAVTRPFIHLVATFRGRLALLYMAVELALLLLAAVLLYAVLTRQVYNAVDEQLTKQATTIVHELEHSRFHYWNQKITTFSTHYLGSVQLVGANGMLLFRSDRGLIGRGGGEVTTALQQGMASNTVIVSTRSLLRKGNVRVIAMPVHRAGRVVAVLMLGRSTGEIHSFFELLYLIGGLLGLLSMLVSGYAGYVMARRALKPMDEIGEAATRFAAGDLSCRVAMTSRDREIRRLMRTLNKMFGNLESNIQAQKRFTADASHELRIPLTIMRGEIEVALLRQRRPKDYEEVLRQQIDIIDRMQRIVDGLLTLARADAGLLELARDEVDFSLLVEEAGQHHLVLLSSKDVRLDMQVADGLTVIGDEHRLSRVLFNLMNNAYKYAPANSAVYLHAFAEDNMAVIEVRDEGPGIGEEHLAHIFDRFYRSDEARCREAGGAGLGLAICKRIVEAHDGVIEVESVLGGGTTFRVRLPLATLDPGYSKRLQQMNKLQT